LESLGKEVDLKSLPIPIEEGVKARLEVLQEICWEVAMTLKKGRVECVYQNAICQELQLRNIRYVSEETIQITYKGVGIGIERIDICIYDWCASSFQFIFELKATGSEIKPENLWQVISYLNHKKILYGAVVNFNQSVKGGLEIQFLVSHNEKWYVYDVPTGQGKEMVDYSY
jgi:GxxExxY protein